jgi:ABC-type multidrug transport system fused ATPase/permease subunit
MSNDTPRNQFEFSPDQSRIIADLASGLRLVGMLLFLFGILQAVAMITTFARAGVPNHLVGWAFLMGAAALVYLSLGWWFSRSSGSFLSVATTQGHDIDHLMDALDQLRKSFSLMRAIIIAYGIIILIGLIAALMAGPPRAA